MDRSIILSLILWTLINIMGAQITRLKGTTVVISCQFNDTNGNGMFWSYQPPTSGIWITYTENTAIANVSAKSRINITGDFNAGEYKLNIRDLQESDSGFYQCRLTYGVKIGDPQRLEVLVSSVGPTRVNISNKTSSTRIDGTEGQTLSIQCIAKGDSLPVDVKLLFDGIVVNTSVQSVTYNVGTLQRSHDGKNITCLAGYASLNEYPVADSAILYLLLKPLPPAISPNPIVTDETKSIIVTCTSIGSRPAPTQKYWFIGDLNVTSFSTEMLIIYHRLTETYTTTSTQTYQVNRTYNHDNLTCGYSNIATGRAFIIQHAPIEVYYAPSVSVENQTFDMSQQSRKLHCHADGNPANYTFSWQHKSYYGDLIRVLDGPDKFVLPPVKAEARYQDIGEYVCIVTNGIRDVRGNLKQYGSGFVISKAPPFVLSRSNKVLQVVHDKTATVDVTVYSVPKYQSYNWLKNGILLQYSDSYIAIDTPSQCFHEFYGTKIWTKCFKFILIITSVNESDVAIFTLNLTNGIGEPVMQSVELMIATEGENASQESTIIAIAISLSIIIILLIFTNVLLLMKYFEVCRTKHTPSVATSQEIHEPEQEAYYNIQAEQEMNSGQTYEELAMSDRDIDKPNVYEKLHSEGDEDPGEKLYTDIN